MSTMRWARFASLAFSVATFGLVVPAAAQDVLPGIDLWVTPANLANQDFSATPIPAGFFGPGSDPFTGIMRFHGDPLFGTGFGPGQPDTIVRRIAPAMLPPGCPVTAPPIPIEILALNLVSVDPITVNFSGGTFATYEVRASVSSEQPQQQGTMTITRSHPNGGTFSSSLPVRPRFVFTRCGGDSGTALPIGVIDPAPPLTFASTGEPWTYQPFGLPIIPSPGGMVDHDSNNATPLQPYPPTSNFFPGVLMQGANCGNPGGPAGKDPNNELAMLAAHGVIPNNAPPGTPFGFGDGTGAPCPCGNNGVAGHGCNNSQGTGGALMIGAGTASISNDTLELKVEDAPSTATVQFFQGDLQAGGGLGTPNADGLIALGGNLIRLQPPEIAVCGKANRGTPFGDPSIAAQGGVIVPVTRYYQAFTRDPSPVFCTPLTWNFTNAYQVTWAP